MSKSDFVQLIPCTRVEGFATSSHSDHTKDTDGLVHGHDARHWYNAYMALYKMYHDDTERLQTDLSQAMSLLESMNQSAAEMEKEIKRLKKCKKKHSKKDKEQIEEIEDRPTLDSPFQHGVGFTIGSGQSPRIYDLSDPDGATPPRKKLSGVTVEVQPGRGFRINPNWK